MKQVLFCVLFLILPAIPCRAETVYSVEILQVGNLLSYDQLCQSTVKGLEKHGLVEGKNLRVRRSVIDADAEAGLWEKVKILMKIKNAAGEIVSRKPDLVVTFETPATQHSKDRIIKAGIPLVFSGVAIPELVGCASKTKAGQGFTGVTIYMDPSDVIRISQYIAPDFHVIGGLTSDQIACIPIDKKAPGDIPVIRQESLNIIVDLDASKKLGIVLPFQILQLAKTI